MQKFRQTLAAGLLVSICALGATVSSGRNTSVAPAVHRAFYVSPSGAPGGDGSRKAPWDLATALAHPQSVGPDDDIVLLGGTYTGNFMSSLAGGEGHPITLRQQHGERATINGSLEIRGQFSVYREFEVLNTNPVRITDGAGAEPPSYNRPTGIVVHGRGTKLVNLVVHDAGTGIGFWATAVNAELHGCLIYNNGWQGSDGAHGVGIATQNNEGMKRIADNIIFQNFNNGLEAYGSEKAHLSGFDIRGNVSFFNGVLNAQRYGWDIFIGGGTSASRVNVANNYTFRRDGGLTARFGYDHSEVNDDLILSENYFVGETELINWKKLEVEGNMFTGAQDLLSLRMAPVTKFGAYNWKNNEFLADSTIPTHGSEKPFQLIVDTTRSAFDLAGWKNASGLDNGSTSTRGRPALTTVFIHLQNFNQDRANVVVYNWARQNTVEVDASGILKTGDRYEVRSVQDYYGQPVKSGVFEGHTLGLSFLPGGMISIPLKTSSPVLPLGTVPSLAPSSGPEFSVFILERIGKSTK